MSEPILSWSAFWDREADELCHVMPYALVGGSAISTTSYQALDGGRFAYLARCEDGRCAPVFFRGETLAPGMFADAEQLPGRGSFSIADVVPEGGGEMLEALLREENRRYGVALNAQISADQKLFLAQVAYPSPIHHESKKWWQRIPRLGVCYTIDHTFTLPAGQPESEQQRRVSEDILLISAIHAGNRIISRRLALLFSNPFRWDAYKPDDRIAEIIARSVCLKEPHVVSRVDDDQKLCLITKLLLGHHLFFPHSPEALTAMKLLGKDPNGDVLVPHGWHSVVQCQSSSTRIEQCVENLVLDLALLVKAFVRWDRPESLERTPEPDLEKEIRGLAVRGLALLCGDLEWKENGEFYAISPPKALLSLGEFVLPALPRSQARSIVKAAPKEPEFQRYLVQWPSIDDSSTGKHYTTEMVLFKHTLKGAERRPSPEMPWLNRYLRARIEHKAIKQTSKNDTSSQPAEPPGLPTVGSN